MKNNNRRRNIGIAILGLLTYFVGTTLYHIITG